MYLDSTKKRDRGFISHAHSDHTARHQQIICTPPTADFLKIRHKKVNCLKLDYGQEYKINDVTITLFPSGHILGSAQVLVQTSQGKLLYTGDFRTKTAHTVEKFIPVTCDILIMETTFGRSSYRFPPREQVEKELLQLIEQNLKAGITPIIFAYPLGKSQEILHVLSNSGIKVAADYNIIRLAHVYEKYDVRFGEFENFRRSDYRNRVILLPVNQRHQRFVKNMEAKQTIFMSGWGMDAAAKYRFKVDRVMPYSDHADYDELIQTATQSGAKKIYCTHGPADFVTTLQNEGFDAHPLVPRAQLDLFERNR